MDCDPLQHTSIYQQREDSDDSDGEGGLGNVNRLIMRPPGHSGKAKRGHLCFDASFETGNLGRVDLVNEFEYDLFVRPDTCCPRLRFWFNFTVDNVRLDQRVVFNIVNINKSRNLFNSGLTPLVKSTTRSKWQRIPKRHVFYNKSPAHRGHYILSFAFGFDKEDEIFQFALAPPYSYSRLQTYLSVLERKSAHLNESFKREHLGNSIQQRRVDVITVGTLDTKKTDARRHVVAIMARVHPGDSPASLVCQGLLELLVGTHPIATTLREHVIFKVIPMLNPDGVFLGNYRSSVMGFDLNRAWNNATAWGHPTIRAALDLLVTLDKSNDFQLDFVIDIHANSTLQGCFIYGNSYDDVYRYERHIVFPKLLTTTADDYVPESTMFNSDSTKIGTARRFLCSTLSDRVNCYTFEVSFYGYKLKNSEITIPYTEESYMRCGRNLIRAILKYFNVTGIIPVKMPSEIPQKKRRWHSHRSRPTTRSSQRSRPETNRACAVLHFNDLTMSCNYESETSGEESFRKRHVDVSSKKSPPPTTFVVIPEPTLSIIDFNLITRQEIERARKRNVRREK